MRRGVAKPPDTEQGAKVSGGGGRNCFRGTKLQFRTATGTLRLEGGDNPVNLLHDTERRPEHWPRRRTLCWACFTAVHRRVTVKTVLT